MPVQELYNLVYLFGLYEVYLCLIRIMFTRFYHDATQAIRHIENIVLVYNLLSQSQEYGFHEYPIVFIGNYLLVWYIGFLLLLYQQLMKIHHTVRKMVLALQLRLFVIVYHIHRSGLFRRN